MKNQTSTLQLFLDNIKSDNNLKYEEVVLDLALIATLKSLKKASHLLNKNDSTKVNELICNIEYLDINLILNIFAEAKKTDKLKEIVDESVNELIRDYIKNQFDKLNYFKKIEVLKNLPELAELNLTN